MPVLQFGECPDSRSGQDSPPSETRKYFCVGEPDRNIVEAYAAGVIPAVLVLPKGTVYRQSLKVDFTSSNYAIVTADYTTVNTTTGSFSWDYDTTGGTVNIKASKETIASYPDGAAQHGGAIGVNKDEVEGTEVIIPALKITASYKHPSGVVNLSRVKTLARNTGKCNSGEFLTFAAGEVLFLGATGSDGSSNEAESKYHFAMSENLSDQIIAGIEGIAKKGWEYAWVEFKPSVAGGKPIRAAKAVHVERVYDLVNLSSLLGFG